ncbi:Glycosyl transferase [Bifidobacterium kimbladii]|uniref:Glycosyl transferase n=2 Tax=Bifidobacterium TaxID=1678 RepID=A0A0F4L2S1_9BIFI|nr:Glycosyl transferase [Bifidobacterium asteroides]
MMTSRRMQGKRVLITQSSLDRIGGSEVQALELARYLQSVGCIVTVYAWIVDDLVGSLFAQSGVRIITSNMVDSADLHMTDFDLIWVQHEVLPKAFFQQLEGLGSGSRPCVIFSHMSPYREVHLEQPYTYELENRIADRIVFNSSGTLEAQQGYFSKDDSRLAIYPNPAPMSFVEKRHTIRPDLGRILIVSNHTPSELLLAVDSLKARGLMVDRLGDVTEQANSLTTPDLLDRYDCVVTIGKTVQYCLVQGIPVFIYDRFGGPGYLTAENYEQAARFNFSGRMEGSCPSLVDEINRHAGSIIDGPTLAAQILEGYTAACDFQTARHDEFIRRFAIDGAVDRVVGDMSARPESLTGIDKGYVDYLFRNSQMVEDYVRSNQLANNPRLAFYRQQIQLFRGKNRAFSIDDQTTLCESMHEENHLEIPAGDHSIFRIDFGELPCLITDLTVHAAAAAKVKVSSNASFENAGTLFFLSADPQLYIETDPPGREVSLTARVYPLDHVPPQPLAILTERIRRHQDSDRADLERWQRFRSQPLVALLIKIRRALRSAKTRKKKDDRS